MLICYINLLELSDFKALEEKKVLTVSFKMKPHVVNGVMLSLAQLDHGRNNGNAYRMPLGIVQHRYMQNSSTETIEVNCHPV